MCARIFLLISQDTVAIAAHDVVVAAAAIIFTYMRYEFCCWRHSRVKVCMCIYVFLYFLLLMGNYTICVCKSLCVALGIFPFWGERFKCVCERNTSVCWANISFRKSYTMNEWMNLLNICVCIYRDFCSWFFYGRS